MSEYEKAARRIVRLGTDAGTFAHEGGFLLDQAVEVAGDADYGMEPVHRLVGALLSIGGALREMRGSGWRPSERLELYELAHHGAVAVVERMLAAAAREAER